MRLGVVVVNWNGLADTTACLDALARGGGNPSIYVIDNGSSDGSAQALSRRGDCRVIANGENRGFGAAANQGIDAALADGCGAVLLLNNDATMEPGALSALAAELEKDPAVGIVGCRIDRADGAGPWYQGGWTDLRRGRGHHTAPGGPPGAPADVDFVSGCAMLIRREALERFGRLSERYFMYCEDNDVCLRARAAGFRLRYLPAPLVRHKVGGSGGTSGTPQGAFLSARNRILLLRRFGRLSDRLLFPFFYKYEMLLRMARALRDGNPGLIAPTVAGMAAGLFASKREGEPYKPPAWILRAQERARTPDPR